MEEGDNTMVFIWDGKSDKKKVIAMINDNNISEVIGMTSHIIVNFEGKFIREGSGKNGNILANLDHDFVREGNSKSGKIIAVIKGNEIKSSEEQLLFKIEGIASKIEKAALSAAALMLEGQI